jgi:hypothetical protein
MGTVVASWRRRFCRGAPAAGTVPRELLQQSAAAECVVRSQCSHFAKGTAMFIFPRSILAPLGALAVTVVIIVLDVLFTVGAP